MLKSSYIDGLVQERRNSSALAMELRLYCINQSTLSLSLPSSYIIINGVYVHWGSCITQWYSKKYIRRQQTYLATVLMNGSFVILPRLYSLTALIDTVCLMQCVHFVLLCYIGVMSYFMGFIYPNLLYDCPWEVNSQRTSNWRGWRILCMVPIL